MLGRHVLGKELLDAKSYHPSQLSLPGLRHSKGGGNEWSAIRDKMILIQLETASLGLRSCIVLVIR